MEIFDMFDGLCPDDLPLDESPIDTKNVLGLVRKEVKEKPRRVGRAVRTALIAAAVAASLGVTAYAAYEFFIDKYVIDQPAYYERSDEAEDQTTARISLTGYQGTPEYAAYTEWEAYESDWWEKAMENDPWKALGVDDSWHETPDNYARLYGASFQDQADVLDAIVEKYGLTLHQDIAAYYCSKDLYEALGTKPFLSGDFATFAEDYDVGGYVYEDGSFKAEFDENLSGDRTVSMQMFVNAKGSFATISGAVELSEECEAWQYTTASGKSVDLYLSPNNAEIMTENTGAYISVSAHAGSAPNYDPATDPQLSEEEKRAYLDSCLQNDPDMTEAEQEAAWQEVYDGWVEMQQSNLPPAIAKEDLQTIADSIDFAVLADRFDGTAHPDTADMLPVLKEREDERFSGHGDLSAQYEDFMAYAVEELGRYAPSQLPAAFADMLSASQQPADELGLKGGELLSMGGVFFPAATETDGFSYCRVLERDVAPEEYPDLIRAFLEKKVPGGEITDETVQGCPALLAMTEIHGEVWWYDESADLLFNVSIDMSDGATVDRDAVLALAGSVEKVE